jgi:predicted nucleic acid-binding protein
MNGVVIDASVAIKWFVPESPEEADVPKALALLAALRRGDIHMIQPPHWEAEVGAVLARLTPESAAAKFVALRKLIFRREEGTAVYTAAIDLSIRLNHHLFDTLYHAVALHHPGTICVTADLRYYEKARNLGCLVLLSDFPLPA